MLAFSKYKLGTNKDFGTVTNYVLRFFFFQIIWKKRGYCKKQSRIILIYLNMARIHNSCSSRKFVYKTLEIVDMKALTKSWNKKEWKRLFQRVKLFSTTLAD